MKNGSLFLICAALLAAAPAAVFAQSMPSATPSPTPMPSAQAAPAPGAAAGSVTLKAPGGNGPSANATLAQQGDDVVIVLHAPADETTAAIFSGTCNAGKPKANGPATPLTRLSNGSSQTVIPHAKVSDLVSSPHAIVVQGGNVSPLCGDVSTLTPGQQP